MNTGVAAPTAAPIAPVVARIDAIDVLRGLALLGVLAAAAALAFFAAQTFISRWWLQAYRFGPLEWLWRTLMYGKRQAWRAACTTPVISQAD